MTSKDAGSHRSGAAGAAVSLFAESLFLKISHAFSVASYFGILELVYLSIIKE